MYSTNFWTYLYQTLPLGSFEAHPKLTASNYEPTFFSSRPPEVIISAKLMLYRNYLKLSDHTFHLPRLYPSKFFHTTASLLILRRKELTERTSIVMELLLALSAEIQQYSMYQIRHSCSAGCHICWFFRVDLMSTQKSQQICRLHNTNCTLRSFALVLIVLISIVIYLLWAHELPYSLCVNIFKPIRVYRMKALLSSLLLPSLHLGKDNPPSTKNNTCFPKSLNPFLLSLP